MATTSPRNRLVGPWALWFGVFGGLVAWILHLTIGFALVHDGCRIGFTGLELWLWIITGALGFVALIATFVAYSTWQRANRRSDVDTNLTVDRIRFMGIIGAWFSGLSLLIILMTAIGIFWLGPCG
ncbi:MAG: hypothetical protein R3C14_48635 [Caldilineaceae bacterium]